MILVIFILFILSMITLVRILEKSGRLEYVSYTRQLTKTWSVWLGALGSGISAVVEAFPDAALQGWSALPDEIKTLLPQDYLRIVGIVLVSMAVLSQFIRQKKLAAGQGQTGAPQ